MSFWQSVGLIFLGAALNVMATAAWYRWNRGSSESKLRELMHEVKDLSKQMVTVRGEIKFIQGKLNGKMWRDS